MFEKDLIVYVFVQPAVRRAALSGLSALHLLETRDKDNRVISRAPTSARFPDHEFLLILCIWYICLMISFLWAQKLINFQNAIMCCLQDDDLNVVKAALSIEGLAGIVNTPRLMKILQDLVIRCLGIINTGIFHNFLVQYYSLLSVLSFWVTKCSSIVLCIFYDILDWFIESFINNESTNNSCSLVIIGDQ